MTRLAVLLKAARKNRNLRQPALAKLIGVHPNTVSRAEGGKNPNSNNLERMAVFLGESPERLLDEVGDDESLADLIPTNRESSPQLPTGAARRLIELAADAGIEPGEWIAWMIRWLDEQTPEFRAFVTEAVRLRADHSPPMIHKNRVTGLETEQEPVNPSNGIPAPHFQRNRKVAKKGDLPK